MIERSASRPTRFMSSPWPAMPTTSDPKISGTTIDLIIRRKIVASGLTASATLTLVQTVLSRYPIRTPTTIEITIHQVSEMERRKRHIGRPGGWMVGLMGEEIGT